jgi:hypothetical protein
MGITNGVNIGHVPPVRQRYGDMTDCCSSIECAPEHPRKHRCPVNGVEYNEVAARTIAHHIKQSWKWSGTGVHYYFCDDPNCEVVDFGIDDSVILRSQLRDHAEVKATDDNTMVCYCFGVTKADAHSDPGIRNYVVAQTKLGLCSCETRNPSGRCCLTDFPRSGDTR